jgi:hypothetical protein
MARRHICADSPAALTQSLGGLEAQNEEEAMPVLVAAVG